jgi:hypothetical protein
MESTFAKPYSAAGPPPGRNFPTCLVAAENLAALFVLPSPLEA